MENQTEKENPNMLLAEPEESEAEEKKQQEETEAEQSIEATSDEEAKSEESDSEQENWQELTAEVSMNSMQTDATQEGNKNLLLIGAVVLGFVIVFVVLFVILKKMEKKKRSLPLREETSNKGVVKLMKASADCPVNVASIHDVGMRGSQQDSFGLSDLMSEHFNEKGVMAVVADGMGGLSDGDKMSQLVVISMLKGFDEDKGNKPPASLLLKLVDDANKEAENELGQEKLGKCGSTVVAVIVKDRKLSWISVGDSRIYVFRNNRLVKLNVEHNYALELDHMVKTGELSMEEALSDPQRGALISYIGKGELDLVDQNENPILLEEGDRILLMSDGIFGTVPEGRICEIMNAPLLQACEQLEKEVRMANKSNQDNYTCVVLEVK